MCCIATIALVLSSRIAILVWWLVNPQTRGLAFSNWGLGLPSWLLTLVGAIILPWTTLAYLFVFPGGITGYEWIVLGVGFLFDLAGHGGSYRHRNRIPGYRRRTSN